MNLKIATLNLCLGLKNKKDLIKDILFTNDLDIILLQETEIDSDFDCELLRIPGYILELEDNALKKRVGIYLKNNLNYIRHRSLEGTNSHLIIIDVKSGRVAKRIINIYRSFNPMGMTQRDSFTLQCDLIKTAFNCDTVIMGDLNLDYNKKYDVNYSGCHLFEILDEKMYVFCIMNLY